MTTPELPPLPPLSAQCFWFLSEEGADQVRGYAEAYARTALAPLEAEVEKLRAALAQKVTDETMISELALQGSSLYASFEGGACRVLAEAFADQFDKSGATNYVEVSLDDPNTGRRFLVTLQLRDGKTPHALRLEAEAEVERLRGIQPELPPRPPDMAEGLPRYGLRWNGPQQPLSTPMEDGYWTPWHIAEAEVAAMRKDAARYAWLREQHEGDSGESFCVFEPDVGFMCLRLVGSMPGELDAAIDSAMNTEGESA